MVNVYLQRIDGELLDVQAFSNCEIATAWADSQIRDRKSVAEIHVLKDGVTVYHKYDGTK